MIDAAGPRTGPGWAAMLDGRVRPRLTLLVLAVALLLGGSAVPALMLVVELAALPLLVLVLAVPGPRDGLARGAAWLGAAAAAAVAIQLIPLPAAWTGALPGRELASAIRAAAGIAGPFPLSLDPQATLGSGLALIPGFAVLLSALRAGEREWARLLALTVAIGGCGALLGMWQVTTGGPYLFSYAHVGQATGLFANRNHQGALLLAILPLAAAWLWPWADATARRFLAATLLALLALGALMTTSRATLLLLPAVLGGAAAVAWAQRRAVRPALIGAVALAVLLALAAQTRVAAPAVARLATVGADGRFGYWQDTAVAVRRYWPAGSGFGTFPAVYPTVENLDAVERSVVNHAHNEPAELLLEGGAPAAALLLAWAALVAVAAARGLRSARRREAAAALIAIGAVAAVSLTEFPLRTSWCPSSPAWRVTAARCAHSSHVGSAASFPRWAEPWR